MNTSNQSPAVLNAGHNQSGELVDVRAVAAMLGCSTRHVHRLADAGLMPQPVRLGVLVRWQRAKLLDWIAAGCPAPNAKAVRP